MRTLALSRLLDDLIERAEIAIEPVTVEQAKIARQAYRDYGKCSGHPANLNFGDCFSYALARVKHEPLLYKGNDFTHTDLQPALESPQSRPLHSSGSGPEITSTSTAKSACRNALSHPSLFLRSPAPLPLP